MFYSLTEEDLPEDKREFFKVILEPTPDTLDGTLPGEGVPDGEMIEFGPVTGGVTGPKGFTRAYFRKLRAEQLSGWVFTPLPTSVR